MNYERKLSSDGEKEPKKITSATPEVAPVFSEVTPTPQEIFLRRRTREHHTPETIFPIPKARNCEITDSPAVKNLFREQVEREKTRKVRGEFQGFMTRNGDTLLEAFKQTEIFEKIYGEAREQVNNLNERDYWSGLAGRVFSSVSQLSLSANMQETILSGSEVFDLMRLRHPKVKVIADPFETSSLSHRYVPDGLAAKNDHAIKSVIEYKSRRFIDPLRFRKQYVGFNHFLEDFPELYDANPTLLLVTPSNTDMKELPHNVKHLRMPIASSQLAYFLKDNYPTPKN